MERCEARRLSVAQCLLSMCKTQGHKQNSSSSSKLENKISFYENDIMKPITLCVKLLKRNKHAHHCYPKLVTVHVPSPCILVSKNVREAGKQGRRILIIKAVWSRLH